MTHRFYTYVTHNNDLMYVRGYVDGKRAEQAIPYKPYLFTSATPEEDQGFKTIEGKPVKRIDFESISDARWFLKESFNRKVYGLTKWPYVYINDTFEGEIQYDPSLISVVGIDIETDSDNGFGQPHIADKEIWTITLRRNGKVKTFGYHDYTPHRENVEYVKCTNEEQLLKKFLATWNEPFWMPDVITGWYVEFYDMPYLINRIRRVLGDSAAKLLSPFRKFENRRFNRVINGQQEQHEEEIPLGLTILDYMALYRKFSFVMQESYKLDHIAFVVLGKRKLDYFKLGYDTLAQFYHGDFQKFVEYNIIDIDLVAEMDEKLNLIQQVMAIAYDAKVNLIDALTTVNLWDVMIHNYLFERKMVVPHHFELTEKGRQNIGGYVKDPKPGVHKWLVSFDLTSLYPHLIMQYNISPDTLRGMMDQFIVGEGSIEAFLDGAVDDVRDTLIQYDYTVCPTGCLFDRSKQGFFPALMEKIFTDRDVWKKRMIKAKQDFEAAPSKKLEMEIARCWSMQQAKKIEMNSGYGALANAYFRWFDIRLAESVTSSGQLSIRWVERGINKYLNKIMETKDIDYVLAMDTDSLFINFDPIVKKFYSGDDSEESIVNWIDKMCEKSIQAEIDKIFKELAEYMNAYQHKMKMKRDVIANKGLWTAKKHYVLNVWDVEGVRYKIPQLKLQGIEAVRSSTPMSCRVAITEALGIVMNKGEAELQKYIADFKQRFRTLPFDEVAFPRSVKDLKQYALIDGKVVQKSTPIHVKGALFYNALIQKKGLANKYGLIQDSDKIKFCYIHDSAPIPSNVIGAPGRLPKELELDAYLDYDTQFAKSFLMPLSTILETIGWQAEKRMSIEDFFEPNTVS